MSTPSSLVARVIAPGAVVSTGPLQNAEVSTLRSYGARSTIPWTGF
ncbi:unnamed protein product [Laminaria digitata]